jgi:hypothetical protein
MSREQIFQEIDAEREYQLERRIEALDRKNV